MAAFRLFIMASLLAGCAPQRPGSQPGAKDEAGLVAQTVDPLIEGERRSSGMPGAAFIFVRDGRVIHQQGYGQSDKEKALAADPEKTVWPIASITKVVTAIAALQLVERGLLKLDEDVNLRLRRVKVPSQGYGPLTLRHLLNHTAALDELPGRQFDGASRPDMAEFIRTRMIRYRAPGAATAYSSYGILLAGILVEDASGEPYAQYVQRHILKPLGMRQSWIMSRRGYEKGVATPYLVEDGKAEPIAHEYYVSTPTSSMVASAADMGRLIRAMLRRRQFVRRQILSREMLASMSKQQASVHPALPGWGLGLQLDRVNGRVVAEHGGDIGGFSSLLVLLPEEDAGFFIVSHGESTDLRFRVKQALIDRLWPAPPHAVPVADPRNTQRLEEYAGGYLSSMVCRSCPRREGDVFELSAPGDGTLLFWGKRWLPIRRDLFIRHDGRRMLGFSRDGAGRVSSVSGGSWMVADRLANQ